MMTYDYVKSIQSTTPDWILRKVFIDLPELCKTMDDPEEIIRTLFTEEEYLVVDSLHFHIPYKIKKLTQK